MNMRVIRVYLYCLKRFIKASLFYISICMTELNYEKT